MELIGLAQDRDGWRDAVMNLLVSLNARIVLTSYGTISLLRKTLLHLVSQ